MNSFDMSQCMISFWPVWKRKGNWSNSFLLNACQTCLIVHSCLQSDAASPEVIFINKSQMNRFYRLVPFFSSPIMVEKRLFWIINPSHIYKRKYVSPCAWFVIVWVKKFTGALKKSCCKDYATLCVRICINFGLFEALSSFLR